MKKLWNLKVLVGIMSLLLVCGLFLAPGQVKAATNSWSEYASKSFAGGTGSKEDPFKISTAGQLAYMANCINSEFYQTCYFEMTNDIDISAHEWNPIGYAERQVNIFYGAVPFKGYFDGKNHKVTGLTMKLDCKNGDVYYKGLFGWNEGTITNLTLDKLNITGVNGVGYVGGVAGVNSGGTISNCSASGKMFGSDDSGDYGGIVGRNYDNATITRCSSSILGTSKDKLDYFGGIVGYNENSLVEYCYFSGRIEGCNEVGGIAGATQSYNDSEDKSYTGVIKGCVSNGYIKGKDFVGGIVGETSYQTKIEDCLNLSECKGERYVGGILGLENFFYKETEYNKTKNVINMGKINAKEYCGQIIGYVTEKYLSNTVTNARYTEAMGSAFGNSFIKSKKYGYSSICQINSNKAFSWVLHEGYLLPYSNYLGKLSLPKLSDSEIHAVEKNTVKASATSNGSITEVCASCGKTVSTKKIYKIGNIKLSKTSYVYDGGKKKPTVVIKDSKDRAIAASDYTLTYSDNRNVGLAKVTIKFKNSYSGTMAKTFSILPKATKIKKMQAKANMVKVNLKKQAEQTTGYQVQVATDKKYTKNVKNIYTKTNSQTTITVSDLKKAKKYYVRVRSYKLVKGKKYYSDWSK